MKRNRTLHAICLLWFAGYAVGSALSAEPAKLEVHEWGTFTILSGSDGAPLAWYQPESAQSDLPAFVYRNPVRLNSKVGTGTLILRKGPDEKPVTVAPPPLAEYAGIQPARARMETPVLYFYPEKPMPVKVHVSYDEGIFTETFPHPSSLWWGIDANGGEGKHNQVDWSGQLFPPSEPDGPKLTPAVGDRGAHYAHAREVPDAWWFREDGPKGGWEKFIFYRGASLGVPPLKVSASDDRHLKLESTGPGSERSGWAFALQIQGERARWCVVPPFESRLTEGGKVLNATFGVDLGQVKEQSIAEVQQGISAAMHDVLVKEGLTAAEASAMIATWKDLWFKEDGTRILALLPNAWVNKTLPLAIDPTPTTLRRVFVGRMEIFTPSREDTLLTLLQQDSNPENSAKLAADFKDLRLGRFAAGALTRAQTQLMIRSSDRFARLQGAGLPAEKALSALPPGRNSVSQASN